jgi:25S rRNA (uracil2843-N3)-methyltransferase
MAKHKTPNANRGYRDQSKIDLDKKPTKPKPKNSAQAKRKPQDSEVNPPKESRAADAQPVTQWAPEEMQEQQLMLDVFRNTFKPVLTSPDEMNKTLQEIKTALFNREFDKAFGNEEHLDAYAARWSPTRALCYERVLHRATVELNLETIYPNYDPDRSQTEAPIEPRSLRVVSIGGGAAELAAVAAFLRGELQQTTTAELVLVDSGPWRSVVDKLYVGLTTPPPVSPYANAAAKAAAAAAGPFISAERLSLRFEQHDVLALSSDQLAAIVGDKPVLLTLCFTLNELFTAGGLAKTTIFLSTLTAVLPLDSLLLVVDSAGSYSEVGLGSSAKKYPMHWLMDKVLGGGGGSDDRDGRWWHKVDEQESVWFRLKPGLDYPIQLENMRHQVHVHRLSKNGRAPPALFMGSSMKPQSGLDGQKSEPTAPARKPEVTVEGRDSG